MADTTVLPISVPIPVMKMGRFIGGSPWSIDHSPWGLFYYSLIKVIRWNIRYKNILTDTKTMDYGLLTKNENKVVP